MTTERTRFTISVEPEVYEAFADLAHSSGVSLSRCIGDWLRDTAEAAQMTTIRVNEVRKSHQEIHREYMASQARQIERRMSGELGTSWRLDRASGKRVDTTPTPGAPAGDARSRASGRGAAAAPVLPPPRPVIRGGKSPVKGGKS